MSHARCHFRTDHQTDDGEAVRNDDQFAYVAAWEHVPHQEPVLHKEPLSFHDVELTSRSYK